MSDIHDEKLDAMLKSRRLEPAAPNLADRIILRTQGIPQNQTVTLGEWLKQVFAEFHLPRPAYVLACTLVFGVAIGFYAPLETTPADDADSVYVQSFLYADEGVL